MTVCPCSTKQKLARHGRSMHGFWEQMTSNCLETLGNAFQTCLCTLRKISPSFDLWKLVKCELQPPCLSNPALDYFKLNSSPNGLQFALRLWETSQELVLELLERFYLQLTNGSWSKWVPTPLIRSVLSWTASGSIQVEMAFNYFETLETRLELVIEFQRSFRLHLISDKLVQGGSQSPCSVSSTLSCFNHCFACIWI